MKNKIYIFIVIIILIGLITFSSQCLESAKEGLELCLAVVIPSLFPFFICSNLLIRLGFVSVLGTKCGFLMRPLFNVPGCGAFSFCIGILSGYPVGAKSVVQLYKQKLCTKTEAERLLAFCNNSGPLFIIGAVGTGLYHSPKVGIMLYASHILSALTIGLLFRFYKPKGKKSENKNYIAPVFAAENFSQLIGLVIKDSISSIAMVCGFIVFFSVFITIIQAFSLLKMLTWLFMLIGITSEGAQGLAYGIIELTNGIKLLAPNYTSLPLTGFLLAFSGISVIMQVGGIIGKNKISLKTFIIAKLLQGLLAFVYTYFLIAFISLPAFSDIKKPLNISLESLINYPLYSLLISLIIFSLTVIISGKMNIRNLTQKRYNSKCR